MRQTPTLVLTGTAVAALELGLLLGRLGGGTALAASSGPTGRYQMTIGATSMTTHVYLTDTETGRVWYQNASGWEEQSPAWAARNK